MIKRYYEVLCDNCGDVIDYYPYCKPSTDDFHRDGVICTPTEQFCCEECHRAYLNNNQNKPKTAINPARATMGKEDTL